MDALILGSAMVVEELVDFENPSCGVSPVEMWNFEFHVEVGVAGWRRRWWGWWCGFGFGRVVSFEGGNTVKDGIYFGVEGALVIC